MQSPVIERARLPAAERALAICAHPDDVESWCGGTLALLAAGGCAVTLVVCTGGEKGSADRAATPAMVRATRMAEQQAAAALLGLRETRFLDGVDGELEDTRALRGAIVRLVRELRPEIVFTHDPEAPWPPYTAHRDHRVVGRVTLDALYPDARDHLAFPEQIATGLEPHAVRQAWLFASAAATTAVDVSATLERKISARLAHDSQTPDRSALPDSWRGRARAIGAPWGLAAAETFTVVGY